MKKYDTRIDALPGTGGELAQVLINYYQLNVSLETTKLGDHYDPDSKTVRLSPQYFNGKSLTSIAIAAHEVGHAIQDKQHNKALIARGKMVVMTQKFDKIGAGILFITPLIMAFTHSPMLGLLAAFIGLLSMGASVIVHLLSLPVEFDASFNKALPALKEGQYVTKYDLKPIRLVLLAASLTYVTGALGSLLNIWRWIQILKR